MKAPTTARRFLAAMILAVMALFLLPSSSMAAVDTPNKLVTAEWWENGGGLRDPSVKMDDSSKILPVSRWADVATGLHWRGEGGTSKILTDLGTRIQRDATSPLYMTIGNTAWSWSTSMTIAATQFDILEPMGAKADAAAGKLGDALFKSGIIVVLVVVVLLAVIFRARRGAVNWKPLGRTVIVVGLLAVMVAGAQGSREINGNYSPGTMSPGWIATNVNSIIGSLASAPAAALAVTNDGFNGAAAAEGANPAPGGCAVYVRNLERAYQDAAVPQEAPGVALPSYNTAIPILMSRMWEATGLEAWKVSQFGQYNSYGDYMYCRYLEQRGNVSASQQIAITSQPAPNTAGGVPTMNPKSAAWKTNGDNDHEDRNLIAWAMCRPTPNGTGWQIAGDWPNTTRGTTDTVSPDDCAKWWSESYFTGESGSEAAGPIADDGVFEFEGSIQYTMNDTEAAPSAREFLLSLHGPGAPAGANMALVMSYMLSAVILFFVFSGIALAIFIAKVAAVVMIIATPFALLKDMLPHEGPSQTGKFFRSFLGFSFVAYGVQIIYAFVAMISGFLISLATSWWGGASIIAMVWTGAAPLIAVLVVHLLFTKVLKLPSPLSINGGQAWAKAASGGAIGGAIGAGMTNAVMNRGKTFARGAGAAAGSAVKSKVGAVAGGRGPKAAPAPSGFSTSRTGDKSATTGTSTADVMRKDADLAKAAAAGAAGGAVAAGAVKGKSAPAELTNRDAERMARAADKAEYDRATTGLSKKEIRGQVTEARKAERDQRIEARGYDGGVLGDAREGLSRKVEDNVAAIRGRSAGANIKALGAGTVDKTVKVAKVAGRVGGRGLAVAATGGFALPIIAAEGLYKGTKRTYRAVQGRQDADRRRVIAARSADAARAAAHREQVTAEHTRRVEGREMPRSAVKPTSTPNVRTSAKAVTAPARPSAQSARVPGVVAEKATDSGLLVDSRSARRMSEPKRAMPAQRPVVTAPGQTTDRVLVGQKTVAGARTPTMQD